MTPEGEWPSAPTWDIRGDGYGPHKSKEFMNEAAHQLEQLILADAGGQVAGLLHLQVHVDEDVQHAFHVPASA